MLTLKLHSIYTYIYCTEHIRTFPRVALCEKRMKNEHHDVKLKLVYFLFIMLCEDSGEPAKMMMHDAGRRKRKYISWFQTHIHTQYDDMAAA